MKFVIGGLLAVHMLYGALYASRHLVGEMEWNDWYGSREELLGLGTE